MSRESAEPRGKELLCRYRENYKIADNYNLTEDMVLNHWELEKNLAKTILNSNKKNRWEIVSKCYTELYEKLSWLNVYVDTKVSIPSEELYFDYIQLLTKPPKKIYEIGSGKGGLIKLLSNMGYLCKGTEITSLRGGNLPDNGAFLSWGVSDGVHLGEFETKGSYDYVISNHVIEHLHPDDILDHFKGVFKILNFDGAYLLKTPHRFAGPSDVSRVFKKTECMGMHLKEYTYTELKYLTEKSGFNKIEAVLVIPKNLRRLLRIRRAFIKGTWLFYLFLYLEFVMQILPEYSLRKFFCRKTKLLFSIFLIVKKPKSLKVNLGKCFLPKL